MDASEGQQCDNSSCSRRSFVTHAARITAGTTLAHAAILTGSGYGGAATSLKPVEYQLRASRFTGAPDGRRREIWGYNQQLPGPLIRAKEGETLRIRVVNDLGVPTSVHWHGIHQHGT